MRERGPVLRVALRHGSLMKSANQEPALTIGELTIDFARRVVTIRGEETHLTPIEYRLLTTLARNLGMVLTHRQLLQEVWGPAYTTQTQYLRVYMAQLRQKLEETPARPRYLVTEPGVGYRLKSE